MANKLQMPQRSVTRFAIPLIDVLTLLFCIYLLMPMVSSADGKAPEDTSSLKKQISDLERKLREKEDGEDAKLRREIAELKKVRGKAILDRLALRVLEIDPKDGKLFYRAPERVPLNDGDAARELIDKDRRARGVGERELYYLILCPRERSAFPTLGQEEEYRAWFERWGALVAFDRPGTVTRGGKP